MSYWLAHEHALAISSTSKEGGGAVKGVCVCGWESCDYEWVKSFGGGIERLARELANWACVDHATAMKLRGHQVRSLADMLPSRGLHTTRPPTTEGEVARLDGESDGSPLPPGPPGRSG